MAEHKRFEVSQNSPVASVSLANGTSHTGLLAYGWAPDDPFVATVRISIALNTLPVDADSFPGGLSCANCRGNIQWGGFACNAGEGYIVCLRCGNDLDKLGMDTQDWVIGLSLFAGVLAGNDTSKDMPGEVQMYRAWNGELVIVLTNRDSQQHIRLVAPLANMKEFVKQLVKVRGKLNQIEAEYLNQGVAELEKWANEVR